MPIRDVRLEKVFIKNYLSLHDIEFPLKSLTVLVGPNASGKSNILEALQFLKDRLTSEDLPPVEVIKDIMWAGKAENIELGFEALIGRKKVRYSVKFKPVEENRIAHESLVVGKVNVILTKNGEGRVKDEEGKNSTDYRSKKLALKSAGDYGNKPVTNRLNRFIKSWQVYDFNPRAMRGKGFITVTNDLQVPIAAIDFSRSIGIDNVGANIKGLLLNWHSKDSSRFQRFLDKFSFLSGVSLEPNKEKDDINSYEGYLNPIAINKVSDGTLRLLAYLALLNQEALPSLIAIEEPERDLHPAWLTALGEILILLANRTQVIITTHSSQLLDSLDPQELNEGIGILLLRNVRGQGTEVFTLDDIRKNREGLQSWIDEFGIGSALFNSEIIQDIMRNEKEIKGAD